MKRATINLFGSRTCRASRSFVIEVADDVSFETLDRQILDTLADEARVPWAFDADGYLETFDHTIEQSDADAKLPVISLARQVFDQRHFVPEDLMGGPA